VLADSVDQGTQQRTGGADPACQQCPDPEEKLAYTVLATSLAHQFGLEWGVIQLRSFRFVVIDEAFGCGSDDSARYGLELFKRMNLQLLIVTPLQKIHISSIPSALRWKCTVFMGREERYKRYISDLVRLHTVFAWNKNVLVLTGLCRQYKMCRNTLFPLASTRALCYSSPPQ